MAAGDSNQVEADVDIHPSDLEPVREGRQRAEEVFGVPQPPSDVPCEELEVRKGGREGRRKEG